MKEVIIAFGLTVAISMSVLESSTVSETPRVAPHAPVPLSVVSTTPKHQANVEPVAEFPEHWHNLLAQEWPGPFTGSLPFPVGRVLIAPAAEEWVSSGDIVDIYQTTSNEERLLYCGARVVFCGNGTAYFSPGPGRPFRSRLDGSVRIRPSKTIAEHMDLIRVRRELSWGSHADERSSSSRRLSKIRREFLESDSVAVPSKSRQLDGQESGR